MPGSTSAVGEPRSRRMAEADYRAGSEKERPSIVPACGSGTAVGKQNDRIGPKKHTSRPYALLPPPLRRGATMARGDTSARLLSQLVVGAPRVPKLLQRAWRPRCSDSGP